MKKNKVYIVGAGPGDAGLVTVKAMECIKRADVLFYDRLIPKSILKHKKRGSILKYVGKAKGKLAMSQEDINLELLRYAKAGKTVVRLKGGDAFIFGRGSEEVLFLETHGVPCEMIPGVSSFYSVPEICRIPLTYRGLASGFVVVTGHEDPKKKSCDVDWRQVARFKGTVVILMGKSNLGNISKTLIRCGKDGKTPCAVISKGTVRKERLVTGMLKEIACKTKHLTAPAIIVMGDVVCLRSSLTRGAKPLAGRKYISTASADLSRDIAKKLRRVGAHAECVPMIRIVPVRDYSTVDRVISDVRRLDWLVFTSRYGVHYFLKRFFARGGQRRDLRGKIACVGSGTSQELKTHEIPSSLVPEKFTTRDLGFALKKEGVAGKRIALLRTKMARDTLKRILLRSGAEITDCHVYGSETLDQTQYLSKAISKKPDGIFFLSPMSVDRFFEQIPRNLNASLRDRGSFFSIGPVTTRALKRRGVKRVYSPERHTINELVHLCIKKAGSELEKAAKGNGKEESGSG